MSKINKRGGFTLAELLIVIAIMAILVSIAIPAFGASLHKANIAVDHASVRNAYAFAMTAQLTGQIDTGSGAETVDTTKKYVYCKDGTVAVSTSASTAYQLKEEAKAGECADVQGCTEANHKKDNYIVISYDSNTWKVSLVDSLT